MGNMVKNGGAGLLQLKHSQFVLFYIVPLLHDLCFPPAVQVFSSVLHVLCVKIKWYTYEAPYNSSCTLAVILLVQHLASLRSAHLVYFYGCSNSNTDT